MGGRLGGLGGGQRGPLNTTATGGSLPGAPPLWFSDVAVWVPPEPVCGPHHPGLGGLAPVVVPPG
jgi:hypothetical protein